MIVTSCYFDVDGGVYVCVRVHVSCAEGARTLRVRTVMLRVICGWVYVHSAKDTRKSDFECKEVRF